MNKQHEFCTRCKSKLREFNKDTYNIIWLAIDKRTGKYTDQKIPDEFIEDIYPFGLKCAEIVLKEQEPQ